jgi:hypothetical protein
VTWITHEDGEVASAREAAHLVSMGRDFVTRAAVVVALGGLLACEQATPPTGDPSDSTGTPAAPVELTISGAPKVISYPGTGRANVLILRGYSTVQDNITPALSTTGPFIASWESLGWQLRTMKVTATDTGSGTVTISALGKSASFSVRAESVTFKRVAMTAWAPTAPSPNGCGIAVDDRVWCWGGNGRSQLGTSTPRYCTGSACQYGAQYDSRSPMPIESSQTFSEVVATSYGCGQFVPDTCGRSCALTAAGEAWCWGDGYLAPVRVAAPMTFRAIVSGGATGFGPARSCGITPDDKGYCFDSGAATTAIAGGMAVRSVALGSSHTCIAAVAGDVWCWGMNYYGELGIGSVDGLKYDAPQRVTTSGNLVSVEMSFNSTCALNTGGLIQCWGMGFAPDGSPAGSSCGGSNSGLLQCLSSPTRVSGGRQYVTIAAPMSSKGICGMTSAGEVDCWEYYNQPPKTIQTPEPIVSMTHGCGMSATGATYCWWSATGSAAKFR